MKLYHFTFIGHLPDILGGQFIDGPVDGRGITPSIGDDAVGKFMTDGQPVVWLTSRDSMKPTPADLAWLAISEAKGIFTKDQAARYAKIGPIGDRTLRLTVELSNSRRLRHYGTWLRETGNDALLSLSSPSALTDWWVYFGTVQRERIIEITRTDAPHVNDAERDLWLAIEAGFKVAA
jgi:hypothetical protein